METEHYELSHLAVLESEAIQIFREVASELEHPVLLFSGGKDSIVMVRLAQKAFWPGPLPFPLMHVDTGHNFPEVIEFRDSLVDEVGARLIVSSVQESIDAGRVQEETGPRASRNRLQTTALLDGLERHGFDAAFGGARRDEERARAKERIFSFRDSFGGWDPKNQRPELWSLYNGRIRRGESVRVFPISNWTELDVWQYIERERLALPNIYFSHRRARRDDLRALAVRRAAARRGALRGHRALPHGRRHELHRRRRVDGCDDRAGRRRDRPDAHHRAR
jgi:sulfate adenylyltransferase subunit 2